MIDEHKKRKLTMSTLSPEAKEAGVGTIKQKFIADLIYIGHDEVNKLKQEFFNNIDSIKDRLTIEESWDDVHGCRLSVDIKKDAEPILLIDWYMDIGSMLLDSFSFQLNRLDKENYSEFMDELVKRLTARKQYKKENEPCHVDNVL